MNANVLHRWLKENQRSGLHQLVDSVKHSILAAPGKSPAFISLALPPASPKPTEHEVKIELRKGNLSMVITWPLSAAADLASWTATILK